MKNKLISKFIVIALFAIVFPGWREIVSRVSFGTKDKITVRLYN
jgi:hypothetical protein